MVLGISLLLAGLLLAAAMALALPGAARRAHPGR
jgi:hypothetical protein